MPVNDELSKRMKKYYEQVPKTRLMKRTPVAIRLDGRSFHTFCRGLKRPFDEILVESMQETMQYLCQNIQGCVFGYTQSDEITLILQDYKTFDTSAWFDYEVQKVVSISASMCTMYFNKCFKRNVEKYILELRVSMVPQSIEIQKENNKYIDTLRNTIESGATFDSRVFNIPKEEVTNLIYWRQLDASKNSVQMVGQSYFTPAELHKKTCSNIQDMLMEKYNFNWNDLPAYLKRGTACIKIKDENGSSWKIDKDMPILSGEGRKYLENIMESIQEEQ